MRFVLGVFVIICFNTVAFGDLDMQIAAGFDGYHKQGCWLPLRVSLESSGGGVSGKITSEIYVSDTNSRQLYSKRAEVFDVAKNVQYLYVFPETFRRNLSVSFVDDNGKVILEREVSLRNVSPDERLIVVVSESGGGLELIPPSPPYEGGEFKAGEGRDFKNYISYVTMELLPDSWKGYDSVDAVVLGDVSLSSFSEDQQLALGDWVYGGGSLIVSGGVYSQNLMGSFVEKLLPVKINGTRVLDSLEPLSQRYGGDIGKNRVVAASAELNDSGNIIVAGLDDLPIIATRRLGYGKTVFLAFDYLDPAIRSWEGKRQMWDEILPAPATRDYPEDKEISRILLATGYKGPLSYKPVGVFLLAYVLCLGPLNYFVLRRTGRYTLIWLSMPAITLVFVIAALGFNHNVKGRTVIINDLSVVDFYQELNRARITSYFGLFSPANRDYTLSFPEVRDIFIKSVQSRDGKTAQGRNFKFLEDEVFEIGISKAKLSAPALLSVESYIKLDGKVYIKLNEGSGGKVTSELPLDLRECYVFSDSYYAYMGDLMHNTTVDISTSGDVPETQSKTGGEKQRFFNSVRQKLAGSIAGTGLIGWVDESALKEFLGMEMDVEYKTVGEMLLIVHGGNFRKELRF